MSVLDSYDAILASIETYGAWRRSILLSTSDGGTVPTATAGGPTQFKRFRKTFTVPSFDGGVIGMYLIQARASAGQTQGDDATVMALEYELGSLDFATGTFTAGVTMPSKRYSGRDAVQSSAQMVLLTPSVALVATTPTVTVTYTNQDGTGSQSCTLVIPTNAAANTPYLLSTSLQAGDVAVQAVSNMTKSAGTSGTLKAYGYLILSAAAAAEATIEPLTSAYPNWLLETGDVIAFLEPSNRTFSTVVATLVGVAET